MSHAIHILKIIMDQGEIMNIFECYSYWSRSLEVSSDRVCCQHRQGRTHALSAGGDGICAVNLLPAHVIPVDVVYVRI